jgi:hypothetical protein
MKSRTFTIVGTFTIVLFLDCIGTRAHGGTVLSGSPGNTANGSNAVVAGGWDNTASGKESAVGGGTGNEALGEKSTVSGGAVNEARAYGSTVGGGQWNVVYSEIGTIAGGRGNRARGSYAVICGGQDNSTTGEHASIGGGYDNHSATFATVGGGYGNWASAYGGTVAGGESNDASGRYGFVGGGYSNKASYGAVIGGGRGNRATAGVYETIAGGRSNATTNSYATIGGGRRNRANGHASTIPGGQDNEASGITSYAAGQNAHAIHHGAFVWADSTGGSLSSTATNQFLIRASGGVRIFSNAAATAGAKLDPGSGMWSDLSDRQAKENIVPVDRRKVLQALVSVPVSTWNYKTQNDKIRHIGPMAQDFHAAFGVGADDRHIGTIDADGVALAALQGLHDIIQERDQQIEAQQQQIDELAKRLEALEALIRNNAPRQES